MNFESRREAHARRQARWAETLEEQRRELEREERHDQRLIADCDRSLRLRRWTVVAALFLAGLTYSRWPPVGYAAVARFYLAGIRCFTLRDPRESIGRGQAERAEARLSGAVPRATLRGKPWIASSSTLCVTSSSGSRTPRRPRPTSAARSSCA